MRIQLPVPFFVKIAKIKRQKGLLKEAEELDALEKAIKLLVNTAYGCFASPYFKIGNTVLANNITARARCEVWKLAKALNLSETITDGGNYSLIDILQFKPNNTKKHKPGLEWFASMPKNQNIKHRSLQKTKLGGLDWEQIFPNPEKHGHFQQLDDLASKHLETFWKNYHIGMKMGIEHKMPSIAFKTSHLLKAHYLQLIWNEKELKWNRLNYAIRGARLEQKPEFLHPMYHLLLKLLLEEENLHQINLVYHQRKLLKIPKWRQIQNSTEKTEQEKNIMPGEEVITPARFKLFNTYFPVDTLEEYQRKKKKP